MRIRTVKEFWEKETTRACIVMQGDSYSLLLLWSISMLSTLYKQKHRDFAFRK